MGDLVCWRYKQENSHSWVDGYYVDGYYDVDGEWVDGYQVDGYSNVTYYPKCCCTVEGDATFPDDFAFYISYDDDDEEGEEEAVALEAIPVGVVDGEDGLALPSRLPTQWNVSAIAALRKSILIRTPTRIAILARYSAKAQMIALRTATLATSNHTMTGLPCAMDVMVIVPDGVHIVDGWHPPSPTRSSPTNSKEPKSKYTRRDAYSRRLASSKSDSKFTDKLQRT